MFGGLSASKDMFTLAMAAVDAYGGEHCMKDAWIATLGIAGYTMHDIPVHNDMASPYSVEAQHQRQSRVHQALRFVVSSIGILVNTFG
jgi:hypothetical protein